MLTQADFDKLDRLAAELRGQLAKCGTVTGGSQTFTAADGSTVTKTFDASAKTSCDGELATKLTALKDHVAGLTA